MARWDIVRRLASPSGLVLATLCLVLPFLTARCAPLDPAQQLRPTITYTGTDMLVGGTADIRLPEYDPSDGDYHLKPIDDIALLGKPQPPIPAEPLAMLALVFITIGVAATAIRSPRVRAAVAAGSALVAALAMIAATLRTRQHLADLIVATLPLPSDEPGHPVVAEVARMIEYRYGFWLMTGLLVVVGLANTVAAVPRDKNPPPIPSPSPPI